jgi:hypothetical protein
VGGWGHGAAAALRGRMRSAGVVAREAGGQLQPTGAMAWRGTAGRGSADRGCNWPMAKPSTKVLNAKKKTQICMQCSGKDSLFEARGARFEA